MVFGLVSGSRIRSSRVETDSVLFERRFERVEVELQAAQQRQAKNDGGERKADDPVALAIEKMVERREPRPADRRPLADRLEHGEQRRKQGDRGQERDDHAGPGDQPEFGETHIGGRQKRVERGRDRGRGKQKRPSHAMPGAVREPRADRRSANRSAR